MLLREYIGDALRIERTRQERSLRDVASSSVISLGYLSEVERGQKEVSSELLRSICDALGLTVPELLVEVTARMHMNLNDELNTMVEEVTHGVL
jgi:transcriptional regulator with XRE-family HTH domain